MSPSTKPQRAAALALALLSGACTTVGPDFKRPDAPPTATYAAPGETAPVEADLAAAAAATGPWWRALGSPELDAVMRQALADNPTLAEAEATLAQAQSALAEARGVAGPQVSANAGANRERANLQSFGFTSLGDVRLRNPTFNLFSVGGGVGYDLDLFGGQRRRIEGAEATAQARARRAEAAYLALTANVALQAATIATLNAQIDEVRGMIAADEKTGALVARAAELGGSTEFARVSAGSQLEQDRALLPPLQAQLAAARHALAVLVGRAPADWTAPAFSLTSLQLSGPVPVTLPSQLVRKRPDILAAEAELHAATAQIGVATADLYPNIKLSAALTQGGQQLGGLFAYDATGWNFGAGLTAPIFDGGALKARRQQAREAARAADARYRQTVLVAFGQVADALSALAADDALLAANARAVDQADQRLRLSRTAYDLGGGTLLDMLDAQRSLNDARALQVHAQGQRLADIVRLFAATGADWRTAAS